MTTLRKLLLALTAATVTLGAPVLAAGPALADTCNSLGHPHYYNSSVGEYVNDTSVTIYNCGDTETNQDYIKVRNSHGSGISGWAGTLYRNLPPYTYWMTIPRVYNGDWNSKVSWYSLQARIHYTYAGHYYTFTGNN
ncbi:hypothetical protein [Labedaea rhizosphaerae]|uniref:Uncharacterized protein n=1 Tax=Labedaea rhizosphaerae TaxID=598644 RepID=A0A4R6SFW2_LABRH|nr:hypothetical protein [Labedaea rhizosphaerae]TDQ00563.1 hypothetical protein EV186_102424 [Labedaea rhizosphaerae]